MLVPRPAAAAAAAEWADDKKGEVWVKSMLVSCCVCWLTAEVGAVVSPGLVTDVLLDTLLWVLMPQVPQPNARLRGLSTLSAPKVIKVSSTAAGRKDPCGKPQCQDTIEWLTHT